MIFFRILTLVSALALFTTHQGIAQFFDQQERWTLHLSYRGTGESFRSGSRLFLLHGDNLVAYDEATQQRQAFTRLTHGLAAKSIAQMGYSPKLDVLVLIYADRNIDLLNPTTGRVINLPYFKNTTSQEITFNRLNVSGTNALIATNLGVVWIDLAQVAVRGHYPIGACSDATIADGHLFAALAAGSVRYAALTNNLSDPTQWQTLMSLSIAQLLATPSGVYATNSSAGSWKITNSGTATTPTFSVSQSTTTPVNRAHYDALSGKLQLLSDQHMYVVDSLGQVSRFALGTQFSKPTEAHFILNPDNTLWAGTESNGWAKYAFEGDSINANALLSVPQSGPRIDRDYFMRFEGEELAIAAGRLDTYEQDQTPQIVQFYDGTTWRNFATPTAADGFEGSNFQWATSVARDPLNTNRYLVTTARTGIYDYRLDNRSVRQYSYHNSPIASALGNSHAAAANYTRTDGAIFDTSGNLFVLNNQVDTTLWVLTPNGNWQGIYIDALQQAPALEKTMFDLRGRLWISSRRTVDYHNGGFLCLDMGGTPTNTADDIATYRSSFVNQDGTAFNFQAAYCFANDRDGSIWLGTDQGLVRVDATANWHDAAFRITQIKVPRNDGTNLADYLLAGVPTTALAIDGAGRKWVGTQGDGLYLISADGLQVIHHFTAQNSPLFSDNIWSLAIHPRTGEVFIGTDKGLLAYQSDATAPENSLSANNIKVYPNPLRPEHAGTITIEGMTADCDIRITNASGIVVANGTSLGGKFEWDGRDRRGNRVGSGVYFVYLYDSTGKSALATKLAIVR